MPLYGPIENVVSRSKAERWVERLLAPRLALASLALVLVAGGLTGAVNSAGAAKQQAQERYRRAIEGANDAVWERDLKTGAFFVSNRFLEILGLDGRDEFVIYLAPVGKVWSGQEE